jgi:MFS family permease
LVATILGSSIAILDSSVVSVALPSIQRSVGGGLAGQQWVSNAYLLTLGSLILLGDIFGERRVFALGVGGFGLTSLLCALAPAIGLLVAFRALPRRRRRAADAEPRVLVPDDHENDLKFDGEGVATSVPTCYPWVLTAGGCPVYVSYLWGPGR